MRPLIVDDIMKTPVYSIEEDKSGEDALKQMEANQIKKILVTKAEKPIGVLERWKIPDSDKKLPLTRFELSPFQVVPKGTDVSSIRGYLTSYSAVYVLDQKNQKLVGVVTPFDLVQAY